MAKTAIACAECGYRAFRWHGRCPRCGTWESLSEGDDEGTHLAPVALAQVEFENRTRMPTGLGELDRVLGGGFVPGSIVLLAGEPGVGKSTLMLQAAAGIEASGRAVLLVCGEESVEQVAGRAARVGGLVATRATPSTDLEQVLACAPEAGVVIVDSIQTMRHPEQAGEAGSVTQVRACAAALARHARASGSAIVLVGHSTKDGSVAGPRALEHLVDAVLTFEGDLGHALRTVRATKNRFGATAELGVFEMRATGLAEVPDASALFLADRIAGIPGSCVACVMEGRRPVAVEVQTLVAEANGPARRVASGLDTARVGVMAAVLARRAELSFAQQDIWASVAGGLRVTEPGIDLALALALAGSLKERPIPPEVVAIGEVGLGGEVRSVPGTDRRLAEAARVGFRRAVIPRSATGPTAMPVQRVRDVREAVELLLR
ncbi:MAG: DNA repair protein RadA [Actinomycetota bacterium]